MALQGTRVVIVHDRLGTVHERSPNGETLCGKARHGHWNRDMYHEADSDHVTGRACIRCANIVARM